MNGVYCLEVKPIPAESALYEYTRSREGVAPVYSV